MPWLLANLAGALLVVCALWPEAAPIIPGATPELAAAPTAEKVEARLAVLNGCGEPYVAGRLTQRLRSLGFDVIHEGNAESFEFLHTVVIDRGGDFERARRVASSLGIPRCIQQISADQYRLEDVAVVIGRDHEWLRLLDH
jgi:hypothetical protein